MTEACKDCRFIEVAIEDGRPSTTTGYCRRFPPAPIAVNQSAFAPVKLEWWCGEWAQKPPTASDVIDQMRNQGQTSRRKPPR